MADRATIYLVPHFHYDPVWIRDQATYTRRALELVRGYLDSCRKDPAYKVLLSEMDYLRPYWATFAEERDFIRSLVAQGRLHTGGSYSEPNQMSIQGEGIIRNIIHGRLFHDGVIGHHSRVYLPFDVFGHVVQLPQILAKSGFGASIFSKPIVGARPLSWGLAPDGSRVILKREGYAFRAQSLEEFWQKISSGLENQKRLGLNVDLRLMGGDMAAPPDWLPGHCAELAEGDPAVIVAGPNEYLDALEKEMEERRSPVPVMSRDLCLYHAGTAVSRAELKIANRLCENALTSAEKFAAFAHLLGAEYPYLALDKAWRQVLFGQHHDAITGTCGDRGFLDLMAGYRDALSLASEALSNSLDYITAAVDTTQARPPADGQAIVVFNPLSWQRTDVCRAVLRFDPPVPGFALRDSFKKPVPCELVEAEMEGELVRQAEVLFVARDVPSVGYAVYVAVPAKKLPERAHAKQADSAVIANEFFSVQASKEAGGGITSIRDLRAKREVLNPQAGHPANQIVALKEKPDREEPAWEVFTTGEKTFSKDFPCEMLVEESPVRKTIRVTGDFPGLKKRVQETTLYQGVQRIDFSTQLVGCTASDELFAVTFPLQVAGSMAVFEDRFVSVARKKSKGWLDFRTFRNNFYSDCALYAAQNWLELGSSLRVVCGAGAQTAVFPVGYTALVTSHEQAHRSLAYLLQQALARKGITCTPWFEDEDVDSDRSFCTFRIVLATPSENAYARGLLETLPPQHREAMNRRLAESGYAFAVSARSDGPEGWEPVPELLVMARDNSALQSAVQALIADLEDRVIALPADSNATGSASVADDYGVAIINRGTLGCSIENDDTACLCLMHTAAWPGQDIQPLFVPEHKTHHYQYALYPHAGDWAQGRTVEAGYEFNHPFIARQAPIQKGPLPARHAFVTVQPAGVILTALKPKGDPGASFRRPQPASAFIARLYESRGSDCECAVTAWPGIASAWRTDLLENRTDDAPLQSDKKGAVRLSIGACSVQTLELSLSQPSARLRPAALGTAVEPVQPLHARYWEHNLGAAPIGNQPVTCTIHGEVRIGETTRFSVAITNDRADAEAIGTLRITAPENWTITPDRAPYRILPGRHHVYEFQAIVPADTEPGFILASLEDGGQTFEDSLAVGEIRPLAATLRRIDSGWEVAVSNPNSRAIHGGVDLITPLETWGRELVGDYSLLSVKPMSQALKLEGNGAATLRFEMDAPASDSLLAREQFWAVAKVMYHGRVLYVQA